MAPVQILWSIDGRSERREVRSVLSIGRDPSNEVVIPHEEASRRHAAITVSPDGLTISDLGSKNGTTINGEIIKRPTILRKGDLIGIGELHIQIDDLVTLPKECSASETTIAEFREQFLTVLVADVVGYTEISRAITSAKIATMLALWLDLVSKICRTHHGTIDKYIGDCVMAIFPGPPSDAARSAILAAQQIVSETGELAASQWHEVPSWAAKISINSGYSLHGMVGSESHRESSRVGSFINSAFKMDKLERATGEGILVGQETANLLGKSFQLRAYDREHFDESVFIVL